MATDAETAESVVQQLMQRGCFVELKISRWSGRAPLEEADLGLEGLTSADLHHLGRRQLVPAEELAKIGAVASRARARLEDASHAFPITGGRFVPSTVLGTLLADLNKCHADFGAAVDAFCASYEALAAKTREAWRDNAERLKAELGKDAAWMEAFEQRLRASYPPVDEVRKAFDMSWNLFEFALPRGLAERSIGAADAVEAARLAAEARSRVEAQVAGFVGEAALELRRRAGEMCRHVAEQVAKSGEKVTERTLQPLRDLISEFRHLDFTGDVGFAQELETLQQEWLGADQKAGTAGKARESADYREQLGKALTTMGDRALAESEKAAAEALERFLKFGGAGRAVAG